MTFTADPNRCDQVGVSAGAFYSSSEPRRPNQIGNSPSLCGGTVIHNTEFANFSTCNFAIENSPMNGRGPILHWHDDTADIETKRLTFSSTEEACRVKMHAPPPGSAMGDRVQDRTCAQIPCDGKRNTLIRDLDGTLVGGTGGTVVAKSNELRWNSTLRYTDPLGHKTMAELIPQWAFYPKELANNMPLSATRLYEYPGIVREGCTEVNSWNGYKCEGGKQRRVTFESLDGDAVSRRIFPLALNVYAKQGHSALNDDNIKRAISLYTGPSMYGLGWSKKVRRWTQGHLTGNVGSSHDLYLAGSNPKKIRLRLRDTGPDEAIHIRVHYGIPNRVDAYVRGKRVEPLASVTFDSKRKGISPPNLDPTNTSYTHGANYYNRLSGFAEVILRGSRPVDLVISEVIELKIGLAVTENEFFAKTGTDGLVRNIALLMGIPASRIMIVGIGSGNGIAGRRLQSNNGIELAVVIDPEVVDAVAVPPDEVDRDSSDIEVSEDFIIADAQTSALGTSQAAGTETMSAEILESNMLASTQQAQELANMSSTLSTISVVAIFNGTIASENISGYTIENSAASVVPIQWECEAAKFNSTDGCDCDCGAWDPDCGKDVNEFSGTFSDQCVAPGDLDNVTAIAEHCAEFGTCDFIYTDGTGLGDENPSAQSRTILEDLLKSHVIKTWCRHMPHSGDFGKLNLTEGRCTVYAEPKTLNMRVNAPPVTRSGVSSAVTASDFVPATVNTETGRPRVDSVEPSVGSLLGGTLLTIRGANLMPPWLLGTAINISELLLPPVSVNIGQRDGPRCAVDPMLSSATALICLVPPAASDEHVRAIRRGAPMNQDKCGATSNKVYVKVLDHGGAVSDPTWNDGLCGKSQSGGEDSSLCTFRQTLGATSRLQEVSPMRAAPGETVVVSGKTCFADAVDVAATDANGHRVWPTDESALANAIAPVFDSSTYALHDPVRAPGLARVTRAVLGEFTDCKLREVNLGGGDVLVDHVRGASRYLRAGGGLDATGTLIEHEVECDANGTCDCATTSFECRIPTDIPAGTYPLDIVIGSGLSQAIAGSGRAVFEPFGGSSWSPEHGMPYVLEVAPKVTSVAVADGAPGSLVISGHMLDQVQYVTLGERTNGALDIFCAVSSVSSDGETLVCDLASGDVAYYAPPATGAKNPDDLATWSTNTIAAMSGSSAPYLGEGGVHAQTLTLSSPVASVQDLNAVYAAVAEQNNATVLADSVSRQTLNDCVERFSGVFTPPHSGSVHRFLFSGVPDAGAVRLSLGVDDVSVTAASEIGADVFASAPARTTPGSRIAFVAHAKSSTGRVDIGIETRWTLSQLWAAFGGTGLGTAKGSAESTKHIFAFSHGDGAREKFSFVLPETPGGAFRLEDANQRKTPAIIQDASVSEIKSSVESLFAWAECTASRAEGSIAANGDSFEPDGAGVPTLSGSDDLPGWRGTVIIDPTTAMCGRGSLRVDGTATLSSREAVPRRTFVSPLAVDQSGRYLSFGYKIPSDARAHVLLHFDNAVVGASTKCSMPLNWDITSEDAWHVPKCPGLSSPAVVADNTWRLLEADLSSVRNVASGTAAALVSLSFEAPVNPMFDPHACPSAMEATAAGSDNRRLRGVFWVDEVDVGATPRNLARTPATVYGLTEGQAAVINLSVVRSGDTLTVELQRVGGCGGMGENYSHPDGGSFGVTGFPMTLYVDKTQLAGGNEGLETTVSSNILKTTHYPHFKVKLTGPSFADSRYFANESAAMNPMDTFADLKSKFDAMYPGLDVFVTAPLVEDTTSREVFCSARRFMVDWRAPLALEIGTEPDVSAAMDGVSLHKDIDVGANAWGVIDKTIEARGVPGVITKRIHDPSRLFSAPSAYPTVNVHDTSGRILRCAGSTCTMNLTKIVAAPAVALPAGRRRLLASTAAAGYPSTRTSTDSEPPDVDFASLRVVIPGLDKPGRSGYVGRKPLGLQPGDGLVHRWSDLAVWVDGIFPSPASTDVMYVPPGTTLAVDVARADVRFWIIDGTVTVPLDAPDNVVIAAESIVINGGALRVGNEFEAHPWNKTVTFEMRGKRGDIVLPGVGPRSLVAVDGELILRGHAAATEWSQLARDAAIGDEHVDVLGASLNGWNVGDKIVISGTSFGGDAGAHETRFVSSVHENHGECSQFSLVACQYYARVTFTDANGNSAPLGHAHVGKPHASQGRLADARAVVARLTRNIRVKGAGVDGGFIDRFGASIAVQGGLARLSSVEVTSAGQSAAAGHPSVGPRYPISLTGDINPTSYVKGCSVHRAWNRGVSVTTPAAVEVSDNVVFDTRGHSYAIASSPGAIMPPAASVLRNVGILAREHGSGLPSDSTPAIFRLAPVGVGGAVQGNRACGSDAHGFWIGADVLDAGAAHADHSSSAVMGKFTSNVADTSAGAGFFVSSADPRSNGALGSARIAFDLTGCVAWGNAEGGVMIGSGVGHLRIVSGVFLANGRAHVNYVSPPRADRWWSASDANAPVVDRCVFFGDGAGVGLARMPPGATARANMCAGGNGVNNAAAGCAVAGPAGGWVTLKDNIFVSYAVPPIRTCGEGCKASGDGGFEIRSRGANFLNVTDVRVYHTSGGVRDNVVFDADGTLCDSDSLNLRYGMSGVPAWIVPAAPPSSTDVLRLASLSAGYDPVTSRIGMPDSINCAEDDRDDVKTGGIVCDGSMVTLRTLSLASVTLRAGLNGIVRSPGVGLAEISGYDTDDNAWVAAAHARYDALGRRESWRFIVNVNRPAGAAARRRVSLSFLPTNFTAATNATAHSNMVGWVGGEMREMRAGDGVELRLPLRNSTDASAVVPLGVSTRSYPDGIERFDRLNATSVAGAWFIEREDFNTVHNGTDNSTALVEDSAIIATIGVSLSGNVGSAAGPFEGPLICQDPRVDYTLDTTECHVKDAALIHGSNVEVFDVGNIEECLEACRRRSWSVFDGPDCVGVEWFGYDGRCVHLVDVGGSKSLSGGAVQVASGESVAAALEHFAGAVTYRRIAPAAQNTNSAGEIMAGSSDSLPLCEQRTKTSCEIGARQDYAFTLIWVYRPPPPVAPPRPFSPFLAPPPQVPPPQVPPPDINTLREKAESSRDAILDAITDPDAKVKAGVLTDAALAGVRATNIEVVVTATNENLACYSVLQISGIDSSLAACEATAALPGARRLLTVVQSAYDVEIITSAASVAPEMIEAIIVKLRSSGMSPTISELDPVAELRAMPGVDAAAVADFGKAAYDLNLALGRDDGGSSVQVDVGGDSERGGEGPELLIIISVSIAALVCFGAMCGCFARQWAGARFLRDLDVVKELLPSNVQDKLLTGEQSSSFGSLRRKSLRSKSLKFVGVNSGAEDRARDMLTATADYLDSLEMEVRQLRSMSMQHGFEVPPSQLEKKEGYSLIDEAEEPSLPCQNDGVHTKKIRISFANGDVMDAPNATDTPPRSLFNVFGAFGR